MKNETSKNFIVLLVGLALITGFVYLKWDNFTDLQTNLLNFRNSHPAEMISYDDFLRYLERGDIKKVDLYENAEIVVFNFFDSLDKSLIKSSPIPTVVGILSIFNNQQLSPIGVKVPVRNSSLILTLREYKVDFTAFPVVTFESVWPILSVLLIPVLLLVVYRLFFSEGSNYDFFGNIRKARAKIQLDANTGVSFSDVAGIDEAKQEFEEFVSFLKMPQLFTAVGANPPKGVIIVGPPGTGKTLLAKAIAGEAGVPFISISGSEFVEMFVGIGASRVRDLFETAERNSPCILFIDEIDAIGRQRGTGVGGTNDEREQTLNQILTEMDGFKPTSGIIVIAATNRADVLDSALLRPGRFDRQITVYLPNIYGRIEILKVHSRDKKIDSKTSLKYIAQRTAGFSGADLANILNEAAILTARADLETITIKQIYTAIERIIAGLEGVLLNDSRNKRLVAYHEVGHALTGTLLKNHDDVQKVTLIPRGRAQGLTWFTPDEQPLMTRGQLSSRLIGTLGGRAAEKVIFGKMEITSGASNDFFKVNSLARQMVTRFGMSSLTPMAMELPKPQIFFGRSVQTRPDCFLDIADKIDLQIIEMVEDGFEKACITLERNRLLLDQLATLLTQIETIDGKEFEQFVSSYTGLPKKPQLKIVEVAEEKVEAEIQPVV
uniref:ATP-dependent zinc metalloprotease FtsH n=2 Tax=Scytosiphon TaxID=27966 RepID=A0A7T8G5H2_SCYLO|nr:putative chloroplast ATP-dependent protease [Scytosiphon promiscuus]YP_010147397.1 cell division protein FtsH-like protein [Scytosiphon lomentaria]QDM58297.1 putative chloroplast ATP-dependent protease [Scytosiphon promiscuus]QDM58440.1 putative chloroplast ATP-dependent protease [Scytosiphon promiscuus]QQP22247.1 cell division protein FtsH-like protein [Scytosiphon lomentaria]QTW91445.1 cell division protein [Scytosiphon lomentaria]WAM64535.1 putative chloroplast ATP-dependent protease [S